MNRILHLVIPALILTLAGCGAEPKAVSLDDKPHALTVAVAASMRFAMEEVAAAFQAKHPKVKITVTPGASGALFAQITQKAPFDLFLSADTDYPRKLIAEGHAKEEFSYAVGRLVLWSATTSGVDVSKGMDALLDLKVQKISIANPKLAPYGRAAEAAFEHYKLTDQVKDRLVIGENVSQAAQFAQTGAAQAGLFALSLALTEEMKKSGAYWEVPQEAHAPLEQSGVILPGTKEPEAAAALRDFLLGTEGQAILKKHGFSPPVAK